MDMQALFQTQRLMKLHFPHHDGPGAELLVDELRGRETVSRDFEFIVSVLSRDAFIELKSVMGKMIAIELETPDLAQPRWFNGYVTGFELIGGDGGLARYQIKLSPWTALLRLGTDQRIFQNVSQMDALSEVFDLCGAYADFEFRVANDPGAETFRVMYGESFANYFNRRCEEKGWIYWFEHRADGHTLVVSDDSTVAEPLRSDAQVRFQGGDHVDNDDAIDHWQAQREAMPAKVSVRTFDFKNPRFASESSTITANQQGDVPAFEVYEFPGAYAYADSGKGGSLATLRMEEIEARAKLFHGAGNCRRLEVGRSFELTHHFDGGDHEYVVVEIEHVVRNNYGFGDAELSEPAIYRSHFTALRKKIPFRRSRGYNSQPVRMPGPQTAKVVGPAGEEIWCDEYGRVLVQFPWDRRDYNDERASCWVRVNNPLGGGQMGGMFLPRIGQEVVVDFLNGDPDMPVIMGRFYNADNMPPWSLPEAKNQMGLYSRTVGGGYDNSNAFRFDDTPSKEEVWLHAEKDQRIEVENDESHWVGHDRSKTVDNDETVHIKHNRTETVDNDETITVHNNRTETVDKDETITIHNNRKERVDKNETISIGDNRNEDVGKNESVKIGQSRTKTVGKNEKVSIGKSWSINVGKFKTETIGMAYMQNVGLGRMENVGAAYNLNVGGLMATVVGAQRSDMTAMNHSVSVGKSFTLKAGDVIELRCGKSVLRMDSSGKITIKGSEFLFEASGPVQISGKDIDLN